MKKYFLLASAFLAFLLLPATADAVCTFKFENLGINAGFDCVDAIRDESGIKKVPEPIDLVITFLNVALTLAAIIAVIGLVISGFRYMTAGGNESQAEKAKHGIMYAIIGLVVIGISVAIVNLVVRSLK